MIITEAEAKDMLIQEMRENERLHAEIARLKAERDILQKDKGDWYSDKLHAVTVNANLGVEIARLRQQLATAKKVLEALWPLLKYQGYGNTISPADYAFMRETTSNALKKLEADE